MGVMGGENKTLVGRLMELVGWWPFLMVLGAAGGASLMANMTSIHLPGAVMGALNAYRSLRDSMIGMVLGNNIDVGKVDMAITGIAGVTMVSRKMLGFVLSIGGFVVLAILAWFALKNFGHT
jgi:hypothetical protein